jgi:transposase
VIAPSWPERHPTARHPAGTTRRRVLSASVLAALAAVGASGCEPQAWPWATPPKPLPDVGVLRDVITAEDALIAKYTAVLAAFPSLTRTMSPLLGQHREHLAQLRARLVIPRGASASVPAEATAQPLSPPPGAPRNRPRVPTGQAEAVGYLRAAEQAEAAALVRWLTGVTPSLAQLLASIGACEATHAALLGPARDLR